MHLHVCYLPDIFFRIYALDTNENTCTAYAPIRVKSIVLDTANKTSSKTMLITIQQIEYTPKDTYRFVNRKNTMNIISNIYSPNTYSFFITTQNAVTMMLSNCTHKSFRYFLTRSIVPLLRSCSYHTLHRKKNNLATPNLYSKAMDAIKITLSFHEQMHTFIRSRELV